MATKARWGDTQRGDHRHGALSPAEWEEKLCGGGKGLDRARGGHSGSCPSPPLTPEPVTAPKGTQWLPSSPGLELCYTALTLEAVHLVYIISNHPPLYNTLPSA